MHLPDEFTPADTDLRAYAENGAICLRGVFTDWVDTLRAGVERNMHDPGPHAAENLKPGEAGRFFDDYCNWERIPEFREFVLDSPAARIAAAVLGSRTAQFFHEHVLVKEPGTFKATPWHQDLPYYFVDGRQTVSIWIPLDPVAPDASLRVAPGSHRWPKLVRPSHWLDDSDFYGSGADTYMDLPDVESDPESYRVLAWEMQPGDAVLFDFRTLHGAGGNVAARRRRAFSTRWLGDDARYVERPGRTSPPFPGHGMGAGQRLREDWFPVLWPPEARAGRID